MKSALKVLILAGGLGSRLWPLSTPEHPKQFLMIKPGVSLLQQTLQRFLNLVSSNDLYILTTVTLEETTRAQACAVCPQFAKQILLEPERKNTGFAIAWGLQTLEKRNLINKEQLILVSPADHIFFPEISLIEQLKNAVNWLPNDSIGIFGCHPDRISKDFGYIKDQDRINPFYSKCSGFIEKPSLSIASRLRKEFWLWNLGIYLFTPFIFWQSLEKITTLKQQCGSIDASCFPSKSIDQLLIEKSTNLSVFCVDNCRWMDAGSFQTFNACKDYFLLENPSTTLDPCPNLHKNNKELWS